MRFSKDELPIFLSNPLTCAETILLQVGKPPAELQSSNSCTTLASRVCKTPSSSLEVSVDSQAAEAPVSERLTQTSPVSPVQDTAVHPQIKTPPQTTTLKMGLLDDMASTVSGRSSHSKHHKKHHKSRSRSRSRSRDRHHHKSHSSSHLPGIAASIFGGDDKHHSSSRGSFFGLGNHGNASRGSFFGLGGGHRAPSYYKRSPRPNFVNRALSKLRRLLRDLVYYAKRHPLKVFALVIMPLVTGGFLTALLARFGLRLPAGLERMLGVAAKAGAGDGIGLVGEAVRMASGGFGGGASKVSVERGRDGDFRWERKHVEREGGGWSDGLMGGVSGVAKMFM